MKSSGIHAFKFIDWFRNSENEWDFAEKWIVVNVDLKSYAITDQQPKEGEIHPPDGALIRFKGRFEIEKQGYWLNRLDLLNHLQHILEWRH